MTVEYATSEGSAEEPDDYTAASGTLTFTAGDTEKTITVTTREDTLNEADETFTVTLSNPNHATLATNGTTGAGTIENDDDEPELSIAAIVTVAEGNDAEFEVSLDESGQQVTVEYATSEGSAEEPDDYTAASGTLTFTAGDTEKTITVTTREDTLNEADETFTVTLSNPNHATLATNGTTGTGTIENDDGAPELSIVATVAVEEGVAAEFEVSLDESGQQVTVEYATSEGSAEEPDDYTAASGTLTFTAGDTEKTITVTTREDTLNEADETFTVTLSNPNHATLATNGTTGTGTIENDDDEPELSIVATVAVEEGVAAEFEVSLDESGQQVTVEYATSEGSAEEPDDYTAASGTLTFTAGDTEKTITVTTREDTLNEADETFTVTLSNPNHATLATNGTTGTGTIENDDDEPELSIAAIVTVAEGNDAEFEVSLDESGQQVTVEYATSEGSAEEPDDYTAASGTLTFTAGDTEKTITVTTREDTLNEADETFTVTLSNPNHATLATNGTTGTGTIENDDGAPELSIVATVAVEEGVAAEFEVSLDESGQQVTVEYATSEGSAEEPDDYTAASGTLTFTAGDTEKTITVTTREDTLNEADETFTVTLSNRTTRRWRRTVRRERERSRTTTARRSCRSWPR